MLLQELARPPELLVDAAKGRAAIAGDEAGGVEPGAQVALALHHRQAHQCLGSGQEDPAAFQRVLVIERNGSRSEERRGGKEGNKRRWAQKKRTKTRTEREQ